MYREITSDTAAVLHYTYNRFNDLKSRRDRCSCAPACNEAAVWLPVLAALQQGAVTVLLTCLCSHCLTWLGVHGQV